MASFNLFNTISVKSPNTNNFDLSHDVKMTLDMGILTPSMLMECVPGDSFSIGCESLLRFSPLVAPVMHSVNVFMHYLYVPNRILWPQWEKFIAGDETYVHPYVEYDFALYNTYPLLDYLGLPVPDPGGTPLRVSAFPLAAYQMIYNEIYRDQNLIAAVPFELVSGDNTRADDGYPLFQMHRRAWAHDYFTAALPFAQAGAAVNLPIGQLTDVGVFANIAAVPDNTNLSWDAQVGAGPGTQTVNVFNDHDTVTVGATDLYAKVSDAELEATTINDLRKATRAQEFLERLARGGRRFKELIWSFFGVDVGDARVNRPEYITGTSSPVIISEVLNTTGETDGLPQGNMAGRGVSVTSGNYGHYFCREHGFIMGIVSVMPKAAYQQGVHRSWLSESYLDYYWPQFANLGEQEIFNMELFAAAAQPKGTFGYIPRYAHLKFMNSRTAGDFKGSLNFWTLTRIFDTEPALNQAFVECDPSKRIFAVTDSNTNSLYMQIYHKVKVNRKMPVFGTPTL